MLSDVIVPSPVEDWSKEFGRQRHRILIKRDDLLSFPLAGNKFRKLSAEFVNISSDQHVVITVGAVTSNHCRTTAMLAAQRGIPVHLVLHSEAPDDGAVCVGVRLLRSLGAQYTLVRPEEVRSEIDRIEREIADRGKVPYVIAGGCHTRDGVRAYRNAVGEVAAQLADAPDLILLASGTGATQAGIVSGCIRQGWNTRVLGVSVARDAQRGEAAVTEALKWDIPDFGGVVEFVDRYTAGGYGKYDKQTLNAVNLGWSAGLPLDPVYTGKAFAAMLDHVHSANSQSTILFWHTGGLMQYLSTQV